MSMLSLSLFSTLSFDMRSTNEEDAAIEKITKEREGGTRGQGRESVKR